MSRTLATGQPPTSTVERLSHVNRRSSCVRMPVSTNHPQIWRKCLCSNTCSSNMSGMDEDVDFSGWELPPLEDDPDREPPPERPPYSGVSVGSELAGLRHAGGGALDLGEFVCNDLVSVRPTVVGLAQLGSTDFRALSQRERVDALLVIEQHRPWLAGLAQQGLA